MSDETSTKAQIALLAMIHEELIAIRTQVRYLQTMQRAQEPRLTRGLAEFASFEWASIGATILEEDGDCWQLASPTPSPLRRGRTCRPARRRTTSHPSPARPSPI